MLITLAGDETPAQRVRRLRRTGLSEADAITSTALSFGIAVTDDDKAIVWRLADISALLWMRWMVATLRVTDEMDESPEMRLPARDPSERVWASYPWSKIRPPF